MSFNLTVLSIFRQSTSYLQRYFSQVEKAFQCASGRCHAIWLEGDSVDETYAMLLQKKEDLQAQGHQVTLIKKNLNGPYWPAIKHLDRWLQLATCWNHCLEYLRPTVYAACIESDLIWDGAVISQITSHLNQQRRVICPMLMTESSRELFGMDHFYDSWGFSRNLKKFSSLEPYWSSDSTLYEDARYLQVSTGGGMIVSTYEAMSQAKWALDSCILEFPKEMGVFMDKTLRINHPRPEKWKNLTPANRILRKCKYKTIIFLKSLKGDAR